MRNFSPTRMIVARMRRGMTQKDLADRCGVSIQHISQLERGQQPPADNFVEKLVFALGFPSKFFWGDEADLIPTEAFSFRARYSRMAKQTREVAEALGYLAFHMISHDLKRRFTLPPVQVPDLSMYEPEDAAGVLRGLWNLGGEPVPNMVHLAEAKGIEVYWLTHDSPHMDAFSLWRDGKPYIALNNKKEAGDRGRFDVGHELGHLVLHQHASDLTTAEVEKQADLFASAFLLPRSQFTLECPERPEFRSLYRLKGRWKVSIQAMIMRGAALGIFSDWQKKNAFQTLTISGKRTNEDVHIEREQSKLHVLVLDALRDKGIGPQEYAVEHLGIDLATLVELMPLASRYLPTATRGVSGVPPSQRGHMRLL